VVAWLGVLTALVAAIASLQQTNYKKGLAYSTLSQLGYMFAAIGFHAPFAAFFHLFTHASFKALLFLVAGIVIHATDGEEELGKLGGLRRQLGATAWLALIGSLALIGLPVLTAGAFSKDLVLEAGLEHAPMLGYLLLGGVVLTGLYTGRLWFAVFGRSDSHLHAHAPGMLLVGPVALLAVGALVLGWVGNPLGEVLAPALGKAPAVHAWSTLGAIAGGLGLLGFLLAGAWVKAKGSGAALPALRGSWVDVASGVSDGFARLVASVHDGRVVTAIVFSLFGAGIVTLVTVLRH
jgi:NADH-quinone oxidoreductase subunit L